VIYDALLFLHVLSAFSYFLLHGAIASVSFGLERETSSERKAVFDSVLNLTYRWSPISLLILLLTGIVLSFMGRYWSDGWVWGSLGILVLVGILMFIVGGIHLGLKFAGARTEFPTDLPGEGERGYTLVIFVRRLGTRVPKLLTLTGVLALGVILWFMMFKPF
jgi:hypothetical protein